MLDRLLLWVAEHARFIPEPLLRAGFLLAADVAWLLRAGGVAQLERNLAHVLSWRAAGPVPRRDLRRMSRRGMRSYFTYFSEAMTVGARDDRTLRARIRGDGDGLRSLTALTHDGDGSAPIAMGHQGNWDYAGFWAQFDVAPVTTVAERLGDERLLHAFVDIRERLGMRILLTGERGLTARLAEALHEPHVLVPLLADRDLSRRGVFVRAFGSVIRVAAGPAVLALETASPLYVVTMRRERLHGGRRREAGTPYGYVCEVRGPIDVTPYLRMGRADAVAALSQAWVDLWAVGIAAHPEDWHMLQPIFLEDLDPGRLRDVPDDIAAMAARMRGEARAATSDGEESRNGMERKR